MKKLYLKIDQYTKKKQDTRHMMVEVELVEKRGHGIAEVCVVRPVKGYGEIAVKESTLKIL